jgi:hypothetical protein
VWGSRTLLRAACCSSVTQPSLPPVSSGSIVIVSGFFAFDSFLVAGCFAALASVSLALTSIDVRSAAPATKNASSHKASFWSTIHREMRAAVKACHVAELESFQESFVVAGRSALAPFSGMDNTHSASQWVQTQPRSHLPVKPWSVRIFARARSRHAPALEPRPPSITKADTQVSSWHKR